jgi:hypothetical protein
MSIRFVPRTAALDTLSVHVMRTAPGPAVRSLAVEVSYDGGRTWRPTRLTGAGDHRTATLPEPPGNRTVSLRARAADAEGNAVEQTTINALPVR